VDSSYFKNIMIPTHTHQIIYSRQTARSDNEQKVFTDEYKNATIFLKSIIFPAVMKYIGI
jgi:hypothetical protein